ncbi:hypothetical protein B0H13DRAFT_1861140 [Mycena leptocephala]|nr:hypothetical protein B0H13DRAFT_1861140 [Mycena leptocephala]
MKIVGRRGIVQFCHRSITELSPDNHSHQRNVTHETQFSQKIFNGGAPSVYATENKLRRDGIWMALQRNQLPAKSEMGTKSTANNDKFNDIMILTRVKDELEWYLAGDYSGTEMTSSLFFNNSDPSDITEGDLESIFDWLPESEADSITEAPSSCLEYRDFDHIFDTGVDLCKYPFLRDAQVTKLGDSSSYSELCLKSSADIDFRLEHPAPSSQSFCEDSGIAS